ncbi:hypothetical protein Acr_00g0069190 [Actinidia rufa]|uniref:Secreted protein n=1 Tax=Actinidia rufa TaxID=165716 RepID=A0A7J0DQV7_9ERIC|nr:hypothetical protein Acr_00g0069190 [Actinidia rufa]
MDMFNLLPLLLRFASVTIVSGFEETNPVHIPHPCRVDTELLPVYARMKKSPFAQLPVSPSSALPCDSLSAPPVAFSSLPIALCKDKQSCTSNPIP